MRSTWLKRRSNSRLQRSWLITTCRCSHRRVCRAWFARMMTWNLKTRNVSLSNAKRWACSCKTTKWKLSLAYTESSQMWCGTIRICNGSTSATTNFSKLTTRSWTSRIWKCYTCMETTSPTWRSAASCKIWPTSKILPSTATQSNKSKATECGSLASCTKGQKPWSDLTKSLSLSENSIM